MLVICCLEAHVIKRVLAYSISSPDQRDMHCMFYINKYILNYIPLNNAYSYIDVCGII